MADYDNETGEIIEVAVGDMPPILDGTTAGQIARADIDAQIATAKRFPRNISSVVKVMERYVTLDIESAEECIYMLPRGGKSIRGPSIRFAEALKAAWGNCRAEAYVSGINRTEGYIEATATFHDLETNVATRVTRQRRIKDARNRIFSLDMIVVTANAAASIAMREAILQGIPKMVWRGAYQTVENTLAGNKATMSERRAALGKTFAEFGVATERLLKFLGVGGLEDVTQDHLLSLHAVYRSLKSGDADPDDYFSDRALGGAQAPAVANPLADDISTEDTDGSAQRTEDDDPGPDGKSPPDKRQPGKRAAAAPKAAASAGKPAEDDSDAPGQSVEDGDGETASSDDGGAETASEGQSEGEQEVQATRELTDAEHAAWKGKGVKAQKFKGGADPVYPKELQVDSPATAPERAAFAEGWNEEANRKG